jgi:hypothetical protein
MKERIEKLLELKSIITVMLLGAGTYGFLTGLIASDVFAGWASAVMVYYFTRKQ